MTTNRIAFAVISLLTLLALLPVVFRFNLAQALTDASSTDASTSSETTSLDTPASSSTSTTDEVSTSEAASTETPAASTTASDTTTLAAPSVSPALALTLVHIVGAKYVDYCTDGKTVTSQPGDPAIDAHFNVPDAPTPKCPSGMTWDHTSGMDAYDTASGDLEVGQYALQADGTYIAHYPSMRYTSATSTSDWPARITVVSGDPTALSYSGDVTVLTQ